MNADVVIRGVLQSVLGGRRKRSRNALRYLTGHSASWLSNPTALLAAAGVAWGIVETLQGAASSCVSGQTASATPPTLPPVPVGAGTGGLAPVDDATRAIRLAVAAAHADGALSEAEREAVLAQADAAGVRAVVEEEWGCRRPLADIVRGVADPTQAATLYVLAFTITRADEQVSGADRIFLAQLAYLLGIDPVTVSRLEADAVRRVDAAAVDDEND